MLSWFRRADPAKTILGLADDPATAADLTAFADGLGLAARLRVHDTAERLRTDPGFVQTPLLLVAAQHQTTTVDTLASWRQSAGGAPGEVAVLSEDPVEQIALRDLDAGRAAGILRIRPVSRAREAARAALAGAAQPDRVLRLADPSDGAAVMIAGAASGLAAELLLEVLRLLQLPGLAPSVTLVGPGMPALLARLRQALPEFDACGQVIASLTPPTAPSGLILLLDGASASSSLDTDRLNPGGVAAIIRPELPSWRELGRAQADPARDQVARAIHSLYLEERLATGGKAGDQPSLRRWEDLPERFREACRHQASHLPLKLRWAGVRVASGSDAGPAFNWTDRELDLLSRAEHERWSATARLEGWRFAAHRDDAAKTSPLLVPFDALTPEVKDLDKLPVRAVPQHLGTPIRRDVIALVEPAADAPPPDFAPRLRAALRDLNARVSGRLVLRITIQNPTTTALAAAARAAGVPIQLALPHEPDAPLGADFRAAERIAIGPATRHLPPASERLHVGRDGTIQPLRPG